MGKTDIDNDPQHLWPPFRQRLERAVKVAEQVCADTYFKGLVDPIVCVETLRTVERQLWLYAQGRTRPGPKVTWIKSPRWHGVGLAADLRFQQRAYKVPRKCWEIIQGAARAEGLCNPAWSMGDLGHVQWNPADTDTQSAAAAWVRAGFKASSLANDDSIRVTVNGRLVPDAAAYLEEDRVHLWVRSVLEELNSVIERVDGKTATVVRTDWGAAVGTRLTGADIGGAALALTIREGKGFVSARDLARLPGVSVSFSGGELRITAR